MAKEVMTFNDGDFKAMVLTASEMDTLKWMAENAGKEMDIKQQQEFIAQRNVRANDIAGIWEKKAMLEKSAEYIKVVAKHTFNIGDDDDLPKNVSWSKQTFTDKFTDTEAAVQKLIEIEGTPIENFAKYVTPKQAAEAAGITMDRLFADLGDMVEHQPKERTLKIK